MLLVTTCREPCANTRKFAKALAACVPLSLAENRGKKSIDGLIETARRLGFRRIAIINEQKGNPKRIETISLDKKKWEWEEPIEIHGYMIGEIRKPVESLRVEGKRKEKLSELFDINEDEEAETVLHSNDGLIFKNKEILLKIK